MRFSSMWLVLFCAGTTVLLSTVTFLGWGLDQPSLYHLFPKAPPTRPLTAFTLLFASAGLFFTQSYRFNFKPWTKKASLACIFFVGFIGLAILSEYLVELQRGADGWFFGESLQRAFSLSPARPSFEASLCFVLISLALWINLWSHPLAHRISDTATVAILAISVIAIASYFYSIQELYNNFRERVGDGISMLTAISFFLLAFGVMSLDPSRGLAGIITSPLMGGKVCRRLLLGAIGVPLLIGFLRIQMHLTQRIDVAGATAIVTMIVSVLFFLISVWVGHLLLVHEHRLAAAAGEREKLIIDLQNSLAEIEKLQSGLTTVCAWTHQIKDQGRWIALEEFLEKHFKMQITHGMSDSAYQVMQKQIDAAYGRTDEPPASDPSPQS